MENLLYTPKLPEGFDTENFNVDEWLRMTEENQEKIKELDQKAKEQGSILYRFLYEYVGDGFGISRSQRSIKEPVKSGIAQPMDLIHIKCGSGEKKQPYPCNM